MAGKGIWVGANVRMMAIVAFLLVISGFATTTVVAQSRSDDEELAGRLGGTLTQAQDTYGTPDWTDVDLIGYNSVSLGDVDTILVVYYDANEIVNKLSLVYLEKPAEFDNAKSVLDTVKDVTPSDGECDDEPMADSGLGSEVYACASKSLKGIYSDQELEVFGVKGKNGSYSYSIDPTDDNYYEIIVQFGTDSATPVPTPVPTEPPAPTAAPTLEDQYPPVADVRELAIGRGYSKGDELSLSGSVFTIQVEGSAAAMQVWVNAPDGTQEAVVVVYQGDTTGVFEGTWITAYGTYVGPFCFTNKLGGEVCQPEMLAIELVY